MGFVSTMTITQRFLNDPPAVHFAGQGPNFTQTAGSNTCGEKGD